MIYGCFLGFAGCLILGCVRFRLRCYCFTVVYGLLGRGVVALFVWFGWLFLFSSALCGLRLVVCAMVVSYCLCVCVWVGCVCVYSLFVVLIVLGRLFFWLYCFVLDSVCVGC